MKEFNFVPTSRKTPTEKIRKELKTLLFYEIYPSLSIKVTKRKEYKYSRTSLCNS